MDRALVTRTRTIVTFRNADPSRVDRRRTGNVEFRQKRYSRADFVVPRNPARK